MSEERTFTQAELDGIIQERLAKEKAKFDAALAEKEKELAAREFQLTAKETLTAKGFSPDMLDAMNTSSPEAFERSLSLLENKLKDGSLQAGMTPPTPMRTQLPHGSGVKINEDIRGAMGLKE